jgi:hypothetical protein
MALEQHPRARAAWRPSLGISAPPGVVSTLRLVNTEVTGAELLLAMRARFHVLGPSVRKLPKRVVDPPGGGLQESPGKGRVTMRALEARSRHSKRRCGS